MTREELERVEREMVEVAWDGYADAGYSDIPFAHALEGAITAAFTRHAEHRASVPRQLTSGQIEALKDFARSAIGYGETSAVRITEAEVYAQLLERAGPEPFLGPQPEREAAAAITSIEPQADWQLRQADRAVQRKLDAAVKRRGEVG